MNRILAVLVLSMLAASLVSAQTVAEAAQKEKERRGGLQGKTVTTVSNADLSKTKKKPAAASPAAGDAQTQAAAGNEAAAKAKADADGRLKTDIEKKYLEMKADLENRVAASKERVELLDLKLKSLQQKFMSFNSMQTKDQVQREIAQTYQVLQAAGAEQVKAKDDLEKFLALAARDKAAAVGIKSP